MHCVTPVEPLMQCVTHTMFYQSNMLPVVPKIILRAESIQVQYTLTPPPAVTAPNASFLHYFLFQSYINKFLNFILF